MSNSPVDLNDTSPSSEPTNPSEQPWKKWIVPVAVAVALLLALFALLKASDAKDYAKSSKQESIARVSKEQEVLSEKITNLESASKQQAQALRSQNNRSRKALQAEIKKEIARTNKVGAEAEKVQRQAVAELESEIDDLDNQVSRLERQVASLQNRVRAGE